MKQKSLCAEETQRIGKKFAKEIKKFPAVILLDGPLGAGKTHFAQGFIRALSKKNVPVTSPSYSLVNAYKFGKKFLYHVDLYRLSSADDLESIGFWDFFEKGNIILVEWAEKLPAVLPAGVFVYTVKIEMKSENEREISISNRPSSEAI